ncbi:hypothetical protein V8B97DRAFT_1597271 [Scleroderma yunnanense]
MYPSPSATPRSILKHDRVHPSRSTDRLHAVHFPPSPTLTRVHVVHSSTSYDRSPIVVSPNACALPERGCPGRTYVLDDELPRRSLPSQRRSNNGNHVHPRATSNYISSPPSRLGEDDPTRAPLRPSPLVPPPLIPDLSSESDESDGFISLPPSLNVSMTPAPSISKPRIRGDTMVHNDSYYSQQSASSHTLFSLPSCRSSSDDPQKPRRRRQRDRSRSRERNQSCDSSYASDEVSSDGCYKPFTLYTGYALDVAGDSCLGGF